MSREEVFTLIQSHLSDELDVDPARIDETRASRRTSTPTRSTSTRSCRSSRTPTACDVRREAAQIRSVGQAIDFVLAHGAASA
jgi:acyl carrier protein